MRTQYGAATFGPWVLRLLAPVVARDWMTAPLPGVIATKALVEPAVRVSRNITPALAHALVLLWLTTRAVIEPSPVRRSETNWNASAVFQMSAPEPLTVKVLPLSVQEPAGVTAPTSPPLQLETAPVVTLRAVEAAETLAG